MEPSRHAIPSTHVFTLWVDDADALRGTAIAGAHGSWGTAEITTDDDPATRSVGELEIALPPPVGCAEHVGPARYESMTIAWNEAGDLVGTARGAVRVIEEGLYEVWLPFTATLAGVPDRDPPRLELGAVPAGRTFETWPTNDLRVYTSEPLQDGAIAELVGPTGRLRLHEVDSRGRRTTRFSLFSDALLTPGETYGIEITPFVDLAGNEGSNSATRIHVMPIDPLSEGGFESEHPTQQLTRGAVVRASRGSHAVIAGDVSMALLRSVEGNGEILLRLPVTTEGSHVVISYRTLWRDTPDERWPALVGTKREDGSDFRGHLPVEPDDATSAEPSGFESLPYAGPIRTTSIELPAGSGDLFVHLSLHQGGECGAPEPAMGLVVDDVHIE